MSLLDLLLVGAVLVVAAWWIAAPQRARHFLLLAPVALGLIAVAQVVPEGFYWQFLPAYLLIMVLAALSITRRTAAARPGKLIRIAGGLGIAVLGAAAVLPWLVLPAVPTLPKPSGPYAVGTDIFRLIDGSREEALTSDPSDRRNVIVQAWYPAAPGVEGPHSTYMDGLDALPDQIAGVPSFVLNSYGAIDTHAGGAVPISTEKPRWPVVIFMTGYGGPRAVYTSLAADLASRGYAVLALDHPYEAGITQLADGRVVTTVETRSTGDADGTSLIRNRLDIRVDDVAFVLDQLQRPDALGSNLSGHLDLNRTAAIGHSLGGAASAQAMDRDPRIKAAANIDGFFHGSVSEGKLERPFLLLDSDHVATGHTDRYMAVSNQVFQRFSGGWHYELTGTNHYTFTDAPFMLGPLGRAGLTLALGGSRDAAEAHRATVDIVDAFLREPLTGTPSDIAATAARYKNIKGGPVTPQ